MSAIPKRAVLDELVACRALGHAWEPTAPGIHHVGTTSHHLFLLCVRCGTEKVQDIDTASGDLFGTVYYWSDTYRRFLDGPYGQESKGAYWAELRRRTRKGGK